MALNWHHHIVGGSLVLSIWTTWLQTCSSWSRFPGISHGMKKFLPDLLLHGFYLLSIVFLYLAWSAWQVWISWTCLLNYYSSLEFIKPSTLFLVRLRITWRIPMQKYILVMLSILFKYLGHQEMVKMKDFRRWTAKSHKISYNIFFLCFYIL